MRQSRLPILVLPLLVLLAGCEDKPKKPVNPSQSKPRETINKTTQNVLKLQDALDQGGVLASTTISASDPLTQTSEAYRTSVGKIGAMAVENAIRTREALNLMDEPKPLTYDVFMSEIIKKDQSDGIKLAMLPYYQEYAWDEASQKLVVVEFPQKKKDYEAQRDQELGRK